MKKLLALVLAMLLLLTCGAALAETPEGYPEVVEGIDFGGKTIYLYDWWSATPASRNAEPTEDEQKTYDYQDWIKETYNCEVVQVMRGDVDTMVEELTNLVSAPDGTLCLFFLHPSKSSVCMKNNLLYDMSTLTSVDVKHDPLYNPINVEYMTQGRGVYGYNTAVNEGVAALYFNKRILEDAGIDWNTLYDMQADGTWTWDVFTDLLKKVTRDTDNDGVIDIWGVTGSEQEFFRHAVYSNSATYFSIDDDGVMHCNVNSNETMEALNWGKSTWNSYTYPRPENGAWNYYALAWQGGNVAFYLNAPYAGFQEGGDVVVMSSDEYGMVMFPKAPNENGVYATLVSSANWVMPNIYDEKTANDIAYIHYLWTSPTPGVESDWTEGKYNFSDDRAVDETFAMIRDPQYQVIDLVDLLGGTNDVFGNSLHWAMPWGDVGQLVEAGMPAWQALVDSFNNK